MSSKVLEDINKISDVLSSDEDEAIHKQMTKGSTNDMNLRFSNTVTQSRTGVGGPWNYKPKLMDPNDLIKQRKDMPAPNDAFMNHPSQIFHIFDEELENDVYEILDKNNFTEFEKLGLNYNILNILKQMNKCEMTAIQKIMCPLIKSRKINIVATAPTGFGKTYAYLVPTIDYIIKKRLGSEEKFIGGRKPLGVVMTITRDLAKQVMEDVQALTKDTEFKAVLIYGEIQNKEILKQLDNGCDLIVCCLGRLKTLANDGQINLSDIKYFIVDEADKFILDAEYSYSLQDLVKYSKIDLKDKELIRILTSATIDDEILSELASMFIPNSDLIYINHSRSRIDFKVNEEFLLVPGYNRFAILKNILKTLTKKEPESKIIVFAGSRNEMDTAATWMNLFNIKNRSISGNRTQEMRDEAIRVINEVPGTILLSTDVTERGIDVKGVKYVIHLNVPVKYNSYINRIGRVGRHGGSHGISIMMIVDDEKVKTNVLTLVKDMEKFNYPIPEIFARYAAHVEHIRKINASRNFVDIKNQFDFENSSWMDDINIDDAQ